jgi:hypothetical protein
MLTLAYALALLLALCAGVHASPHASTGRKSFCLPVRTRGAEALEGYLNTPTTTRSAPTSASRQRKVVAVDFDTLKRETECNVLEERLQWSKAKNVSGQYRKTTFAAFMDLDHTAIFGTDGNDLGIAWQVRSRPDAARAGNLA